MHNTTGVGLRMSCEGHAHFSLSYRSNLLYHESLTINEYPSVKIILLWSIVCNGIKGIGDSKDLLIREPVVLVFRWWKRQMLSSSSIS